MKPVDFRCTNRPMLQKKNQTEACLKYKQQKSKGMRTNQTQLSSKDITNTE